MILMAHADDETLGAGGLIQKLLAQAWDVHIVIVSDGLVSVRGEIQDNRGGTKKACEHLKVKNAPVFLGFKDQKFDQVAIADLANQAISLQLNPDLIVTHTDTDLNNDHRLTFEVAKILARPKSKPISLICAEIPNTTFWNGQPFPANYYVDITEEIDRKIEAFAVYENELQAYPHPWSREGLKLLAQYHGMQCGFAYAEAFRIIRGYEGRLL